MNDHFTQPALRYYFSVTARLTALERGREHRGPWGTRLHFLYQANELESLWTDPERYLTSWSNELPDLANPDPARGWNGLHGVVLSGADFALIRGDGVLLLDGRVTLQAADSTLIDASYSATVDLLPQRSPEDGLTGHQSAGRSVSGYYEMTETNFYERFVLGGPGARADGSGEHKLTVPVWLNMKFETASGPWSDAPGEDLSWVKKRYLSNQKNFWKYRLLVRRPFVARGALDLVWPSRGTTPTEGLLSADVFELTERDGS